MQKSKQTKNKINKNSPTSTVTCTLIFPFSLEAENISVEMSLPIFCGLLLFAIFLSSNRYASLSLPSGERLFSVDS